MAAERASSVSFPRLCTTRQPQPPGERPCSSEAATPGQASERSSGSCRGGSTRPYGLLPAGASDVEAVTVGATIYVVGGYTGTVALRSIVGLAPGRRARIAGELPRPLRYAAVAAVGGKV